jgi:hypothetical protein
MTDRQRHRAFAFSVVFIAVVCALVWVVERPRSGGGSADAARPKPTGRPLVLGAEEGGASAGEEPLRPDPEAPATPPSRPPVRPAEGVPGEAPVLATARRFTAGFVRYEVGQLPAAVRRAIGATATPSFASSLLSAPPSMPNGVRPPSPPRVLLIALANGPVAGQAAVAVELRADGGEVSTLTELLTRTGREWRISGLG